MGKNLSKEIHVFKFPLILTTHNESSSSFIEDAREWIPQYTILEHLA